MAVNDLKPLSTPFTRASACICLTRIPMARRYDVISPMWAVLIDISWLRAPTISVKAVVMVVISGIEISPGTRSGSSTRVTICWSSCLSTAKRLETCALPDVDVRYWPSEFRILVSCYYRCKSDVAVPWLSLKMSTRSL